MRVMVILKATAGSERGAMPSKELMTAMASYNEELANAGVIVTGEGLRPSSHGKRLVFLEGGRQEVVDGLFGATSELCSGFWLWKVKSMDDALEWARRCPNPMPGETSQLEIRPLYEVEDFGEVMSEELQERERTLRAKLES
ncbi:MAG: YciI family protein [Myxococcales bacterium]|nr:YciI family protein [Myxococcales bacterium]